MESLESRKNSFILNGWNQSIAVSAEKLSEAGFYYKGDGDCVKCFHCSASFSNWVKGDDPWLGHAMFSPNCGFLKLNKSQNFINDSFKNTRNIIASNSSDSDSSDCDEDDNYCEIQRRICKLNN
jgi:hypothetical protein